ncbi:MAG TPA: hypothetical protein VMV94_10040 [Phycisphaerae bacterium]|nr:hypothetical protein [Phycisphaerae bacterium]
MSYEYVKAKPITLRDAGKDEKWLQELISKDPGVLGFGDVLVIQRERPQPTGGRIDLVLSDPEENLRYEVEIMLGTVDESHIVRTIEYWDVERRRFPSSEHRAVIVAEEITNRFFNVIGLLNKAIPIVALQLNAFLMDEKLCLNFVRVLDVMEEAEDEPGEQVDRKYWEARGSKKSLDLMDGIIALVPKEAGEVRIKYNRAHVAVGTSGTNFLWLHPRKAGHVHFQVEPGEEAREKLMPRLEEKGIESGPQRADAMKVVITAKELDENTDLIREVVATAELRSRK